MEMVIRDMLAKKKTYNQNNLRDVVKVFNDGVCFVYVANEREIQSCKGKFNFAYESIGVNHFYQAYNNNIGIDTQISIPMNNIVVDSQDLVRIEDIWYRIVRIQYHDNKKPKYWTLTLQKDQFSYVEATNETD